MRRFSVVFLCMLLGWAPGASAGLNFNGTSQSLTATVALFTAEPATLCAWAMPSSTTGFPVLMITKNSSTGLSISQLSLATTQASVFKGNADDTQSGSANVGTYTTTAWQLSCAVFTSTTARTIYKDTSATSATNNTTVTTGSPNVAGLGGSPTGTQLFPGRLAQLAAWSVALTTQEIDALGAGVPPCKIRPQSVIHYLPLLDTSSPQPDHRAATSWTMNNSPTATNGPPVGSCLR